MSKARDAEFFQSGHSLNWGSYEWRLDCYLDHHLDGESKEPGMQKCSVHVCVSLRMTKWSSVSHGTVILESTLSVLVTQTIHLSLSYHSHNCSLKILQLTQNKESCVPGTGLFTGEIGW